MKYKLKVKKELSIDGDRKREFIEEKVLGTYSSFGDMLNNAQAWFKSTGAVRTDYRDENGKVHHPKRYATPQIHVDLNWFKDDDYSQYTEKTFVSQLLANYANYLPVVEVFQHKTAHVLSLYIEVYSQ